MPYIFQTIIVKCLVLSDAVLEIFVNAPTYVGGNVAGCEAPAVTAGHPTACGADLIARALELTMAALNAATAVLTTLAASTASHKP